MASLRRTTAAAIMIAQLLHFAILFAEPRPEIDDETPSYRSATTDFSNTLRFGVVQLEVSTELCTDAEAMTYHVEAVVRRIADGTDRRNDGDSAIDLIVFPEYTSALLSIAMVFGDELDSGGTLKDIVESVGTSIHAGATGYVYPSALALPPQRPSVPAGVSSSRAIAQLLPALADTVDAIDETWSVIARRYGIYILAGTYFARDKSGEIHNRAILYDPRGARIYEQDKVYLTPFEINILGLSPGRISDARTVRIEDTDLAFTICRDTFFDVWEEDFAEADLWFDLKANGKAFTDEQMRLFETALPERIKNSGIETGATVCLVGEFLSFFWEGQSSIVAYDETVGYSVVSEAPTPTDAAILVFDPTK